MTTRRAGFTLLEIVVVMSILGLLISLVTPQLVGRTDRARRTKVLADLSLIEQALGRYQLDAGRYPTTAQGLTALVRPPITTPSPRAWTAGGYLDHVPIDPWGHPYVYFDTTDDRFHLGSLGADGVEGGEGPGADIDRHDS